MVKVLLQRGPGDTLIPTDSQSEECIRSIKLGQACWVEFRKARNPRFHRKFFNLLGLGFDMWEPRGEKTHRGVAIQKNFERFREDILILAGHHDATFGIDGSLKLTAKSIAFAKCDELEFQKIYKSVLDVLWDRIFSETHFRSQAEVENVVAQLMSYTG
jgi:hypothetical protein